MGFPIWELRGNQAVRCLRRRAAAEISTRPCCRFGVRHARSDQPDRPARRGLPASPVALLVFRSMQRRCPPQQTSTTGMFFVCAVAVRRSFGSGSGNPCLVRDPIPAAVDSLRPDSLSHRPAIAIAEFASLESSFDHAWFPPYGQSGRAGKPSRVPDASTKRPRRGGGATAFVHDAREPGRVPMWAARSVHPRQRSVVRPVRQNRCVQQRVPALLDGPLRCMGSEACRSVVEHLL